MTGFGHIDADLWMSRYIRFSVNTPDAFVRISGSCYCPPFEDLKDNELIIVADGEIVHRIAFSDDSGWIDFDITIENNNYQDHINLIFRTTKFHTPPPPDGRLLGAILRDVFIINSEDERKPITDYFNEETRPNYAKDANPILGLTNAYEIIPYISDCREVYLEEISDHYEFLDENTKISGYYFFDEYFYVSNANFYDSRPKNALRHFLRVGYFNNISPHPLIDLKWISARLSHLASTSSPPSLELASVLLDDLCDPSPFLDLAYVKQAMVLAPGQSAIQAFLSEGADALVPPNPWFDPAFYALQAPDIPEGGMARIRHFLLQGDARFLRPSQAFNPQLYASRYHLQITDDMGPLQHYLSIGRLCGYTADSEIAAEPVISLGNAPTNDYTPTEIPDFAQREYHALHAAADARRQSRIAAFAEHDIRPIKLKGGDHDKALRRLRFDAATPRIDVLIPAYNQFELTVECLVSVARCGGPSLRIILADDASTDPRMAQLCDIPGVLVRRASSSLHFLHGCNAAMADVTAPYLLLLNNDTQLLPGSLHALAAVLDQNPDAAAVGPMLLYPNGRLQEAGCTLRHDGDASMVGVGDNPERACYNHQRDVAYISGACLLIRRSALQGELFDERFAPAYCEDADLCLRLRQAGYRVVYEPAAKVVHHLSASTSVETQRRRVQGVRANQQKLMEKWAPQLAQESQVRVLAFYLPQFHPVPQNDLWWGRGFTEWSNVARALPSFPGHYQPHIPADLGFYDLRLPEVMAEQQRLARRYGIEGFVIYHYRLGDGPILERPMEQLLARPELDVRFAPCWANEHWTRHWDGGTRSMLLEQRYDEETLSAIIGDMLRMARDPRAIRVNGRPLLMIYRPHLIPDVAAVTRRIRHAFEAAALSDPYLTLVESMEGGETLQKPALLGFDASVEFPPHGVAEPWTQGVQATKAGWNGHLYDYMGTALNAIDRPPVAYRRHPGIMPGWDNTARQPLSAHILRDGSPALFQAYAERKIEEVLEFTMGEERLLFVNAWNEWAEGAHMEPDRAFGHRWLAALRQALRNKGAMA